MRKRLTAALLCLCMMLTLLPSTAYAALGDLLGNSPGANQALLAELENLTGQDGQAVQALLEQYGLLDENGNLVTDQTVELDGVEYTLDEIEALLSDPATDLSQIGYVDGVPIALGDLATIIAIERELQRIQETYFSGRTFDGEALDNLNSLIDQIQAEGITVQSEGDDPTVSASGTKVSLDVRDFQELEFGLQYGLERSITSGTTDAYSYTLDVSYDPGLIGDVIDRIVVGAYDSTTPEGVEAGASVTLTEDVEAGTKGADVIYTDIWVSMGEPKEVWETRIGLLKKYQVNAAVMANAAPEAIFMHCLPSFHDTNTTIGADICQKFGLPEMEVTDAVFESKQSVVFDEAENRMHTIKAVMYATLC